MGKHVRRNTNEITLQRSFVFHIYFIVWLDHTRQYYALIKIVWYHNHLCLVHLIEFFHQKENKLNIQLYSMKKSISIITYLCNYTMITIHCSFWVWIIDQDVSWRYIVIVWLRLLLNVQCTFRIIFRHSVFLYSINRLTKIESIFARRSWKLTMRMLLVFTA